MTWGKVDPERLPDSVTCYTDSTIALPLLTAYALARHAPRPLRRLYERREALHDALEIRISRAAGRRGSHGIEEAAGLMRSPILVSRRRLSS